MENPQIAIAVLVEHGGHGGDAAAPMAKKVFEKFIELQKQSTEQATSARWTERAVQIDRRLISHFDWTLFFLSLAFVAIGIMTIYSANYDMAAGHAGPLPMRQVTWFGLGLVAMLTAMSFDYHYIDRLAYPFYGAMLLLLVLVHDRRPLGRRLAALDQSRFLSACSRPNPPSSPSSW